MTKTHEHRTLANFGAKSEFESSSLYGLIVVQATIRWQRLHTYSELQRTVLNSATSP